RPAVVEERVACAGIRHDLEALLLALEDRAEGGDVVERDQRILLAVETEPWTRELGREVERARGLHGVALVVAEHSVPRDGGREPRHRARGHERVLPAQAEAGDADRLRRHL